jgi:hypothetical protein
MEKNRDMKLSEVGTSLMNSTVALSGIIDTRAVNLVTRPHWFVVLASPAENRRRNAVISGGARKALNECSAY